MSIKNKIKQKTGQVTIMLVIIVMVLVTVTTAAVAIAISTNRDTTTLTQGERALMIAESGAEEAILRLLRDPSYTGSATLSIGEGDATITVSGTSPKTITSRGEIDQFIRTVEVQATSAGGRLTVSSWREL